MNVLAFKIKDHIQKLESKNLIFDGFAKGKYGLMKQLFKNNRPDVIFIGNSQTVSHISTNIFFQHGLKIFNYSTVGYFIGQYPSMIHKALKLKPKMIALSIPIIDFYSPVIYSYEHYRRTTDMDLRGIYYIGKGLNNFDQFNLLIHYIFRYLKTLNYFSLYGQDIKNHLSTIYKIKDITILDILGIANVLNEPKYAKNIRSSRLVLRCDFDEDGHRKPEDCDNGDLIYIGKKKIDNSYFGKIKQYSDDEYNYILVKILNNLFDKIKQSGTRPALVIMPLLENEIINYNLLKRTIHAEVIIPNNLNLTINDFHDPTHYNYNGRKKYSTTLAKHFKSTVNSELHTS